MRPTGYFPRAKKRLRANGQMLLMCALPLLKIFVFSYLPMIGIVLAFKNYQPRLGIFGSPWVGLKNFEFFFTSKDAFRVLRNTVGMSVLNLAVCTFANVSVALMLYEVSRKRLLKLYQTVLFIPYFFSWVVVGLMLTVFLNQRDGLLTAFVYQLTGQRVDFYAAPRAWIAFLPAISVWKGVGFNSLIYYSVLMSIDTELFEAAQIDGATRFQQIRCISLPFLRPMLCVMLILGAGGIIRSDFGLFYFATRNSSQLYPVTDTIDTYVVRALMQNSNFTMSAAVGLFQNVVGVILVMLTNFLSKCYNRDYALF